MTGLSWLAVFFLVTPCAFLAIWAVGLAWTWLEPRVDAWLDR